MGCNRLLARPQQPRVFQSIGKGQEPLRTEGAVLDDAASVAANTIPTRTVQTTIKRISSRTTPNYRSVFVAIPGFATPRWAVIRTNATPPTLPPRSILIRRRGQGEYGGREHGWGDNLSFH